VTALQIRRSSLSRPHATTLLQPVSDTHQFCVACVIHCTVRDPAPLLYMRLYKIDSCVSRLHPLYIKVCTVFDNTISLIYIISVCTVFDTTISLIYISLYSIRYYDQPYIYVLQVTIQIQSVL
jgi:hypothetical protein